jgi:hypothetical protein
MKYLFFATIVMGNAICANAQQSPVRTSDPSGTTSTTTTAATAPLRTTDNTAKKATSIAVQTAPVRTSDINSKTTNSASVEAVPIRTSDPAAASSPASGNNQKADTQKKPVLPSDTPITAENPGRSAVQPDKSITPAKS